MYDSQEYKSCLQQIKNLKNSDANFDSVALEVFKYQYTHNPLYKQYANMVSKTPDQVNVLADIPFLPIEFFKTHSIQTGKWKAEQIFISSGTTGSATSKHYIRDVEAYIEDAISHFEDCFGKLNNLVILALLPSYLEQSGSSLVAMVDGFIKASNDPMSGFYMYDFKSLSDTLQTCDTEAKNVVLFGVSYALLDFGASHPMQLKNVQLIETGGMKGRKKEMTRNELHLELKKYFGLDKVYSEYGMTELLSQAYMLDGNVFNTSSSMRILISDLNDPFTMLKEKLGRLAIIDLANINSCAFIQTNDLGRRHKDGTFQVLGRVDDTDIRGCNLLYV